MTRLLMVLALTGCASAISGARIVSAAQLCVDDGGLQPGHTVRIRRGDNTVGAGEVVQAINPRCAVVRLAMKSLPQRGDQIDVVGPVRPTAALASR
jgi:hypothetical protein